MLIFFSVSPYITVEASVTNSLIDAIILKDRNGNIIDKNENPDNSVDVDAAVKIVFQWSIKEDGSTKAGDVYTFQLPDSFKIYNEVGGNLNSTDDGFSVGTFHVSKDGLLTIAFDENVEKRSEISGEIQISTHFNKEVVIENNTSLIIFPINEQTQITVDVPFTPEYVSENITKTHTVDSYNATEITWEIKVNKKLNALNHVEIVDTLSDGHEIIKDSFEIYKLSVNLDGTDNTTNEKCQNYDVSVSDNKKKVTVRFNERIDEAYVIRYKTKITDYENSTFKNSAALIVDGQEFPVIEDSVTIKKGQMFEKVSTNYDQASKEVTWKIRVNYREALLQAVQINDVLSAGQKFLVDSLVVREAKINNSGGVTVGDIVTTYKVTENENGFTLLFDEVETDKAYEITYKTKVTDNAVQKVTNTAELISGGELIISSQSNVSVSTTVTNPTILEKVTTAKFNYNTRLQNWAITVNRSEVTLGSNTTITDTFPDGGMQFIPSSLVIKDASNKVISSDEYVLELLADDETWEKGFIIRFHSEITKKYTISYQTKMNPATHTPSGQTIKFKNQAVINTVIDGKDVQKSVTFQTTMNNRIVANGEKTGSYNYDNHSISWNVLCNEDRSTVTNAILKDTISEGLELDKDSVQVYTVTMTSTGSYSKKEKVSQDLYNVSIKDGELAVQFVESISDRYIISYDTSIMDITKTSYKNIAKLYSDEKLLTSLETTVSVPVANKYVSKMGEQNGGNIDWQVIINESQSKIENAVFTDTPSEGHKLIEESIKIYRATVDEKGNVTAESEPIDEDLYEVVRSFDLDTGSESFEIAFNDPITNPYIVTYSTKITTHSSGGKETLSNTASITGVGVEEVYNNTSTEIIVYVTEGSGTSNGVLGSIEIQKVSADDAKPLPNAEFTLYKNDVAIRKIKTDANGKLLFDFLLYGNYRIEETSAPEGYVLDGKAIYIIIDKEHTNYTFTVENTAERIDTPDDSTNTDGAGDSTDTVKPGDSDGSSDTEEPGESDGSSDTEEPGDSDGSSGTEIPGGSDESSGTEEPGDSDGSSDTEIPGGSDASSGEENSGIPEENETPDDSINVSQPNTNDSSLSSDISQLPQTGEQSFILYYLSGLIFFFASIFFLKQHYSNRVK